MASVSRFIYASAMANSAHSMWRHDRALFDKVKDVVPRPPGILDLTFEETEDSLGDPAAWIWVVIAPEPEPTDERVREVSRYIDRLKDELIQGGFETWPIMRMREIKQPGRRTKIASRS